jgi:hypothetical protein
MGCVGPEFESRRSHFLWSENGSTSVASPWRPHHASHTVGCKPMAQFGTLGAESFHEVTADSIRLRTSRFGRVAAVAFTRSQSTQEGYAGRLNRVSLLLTATRIERMPRGQRGVVRERDSRRITDAKVYLPCSRQATLRRSPSHRQCITAVHRVTTHPVDGSWPAAPPPEGARTHSSSPLRPP